MRVRGQPFCDLWPSDQNGRLLGGALLLVWGLSLALTGLGLQHSAFASAFQLYWPAPFIAWGFLGFLWHLARGTSGMLFHLLVAALAGLVEVDTLRIAHLAVGTLFIAVLLGGLGLGVLRTAHRRHWA